MKHAVDPLCKCLHGWEYLGENAATVEARHPEVEGDPTGGSDGDAPPVMGLQKKPHVQI